MPHRRERGDLGTYEAMSGDCVIAEDTVERIMRDLPCWLLAGGEEKDSRWVGGERV